jgi:hypothetical protein
MIEFEPYCHYHTGFIDLAPDQMRAAIEGPAWIGFYNNKPIGVAGFVNQWSGRATAWAIFKDMPKTAWPAVVRKVAYEMGLLLLQGIHRIEATVPVNYGAGCRLAQMLGFVAEARLKAYGPDRQDHFMFVRLA